MLNRSKLAAVGLLAAVFVAGGLAGWGGREATERDGRGPRRGPDAMVAYLSRELDLSSAQRDSVRAIFARHRPETDSLWRSEEHTSELQSQSNLVCRLLLEKKKKKVRKR